MALFLTVVIPHHHLNVGTPLIFLVPNVIKSTNPFLQQYDSLKTVSYIIGELSRANSISILRGH